RALRPQRPGALMTTSDSPCAEERLTVDPALIGISYSGGGPLLAVELGIARAFVLEGIKPAFITGVSAGAIAGAAHALDVENGWGIDRTVDQLGSVTNNTLELDFGDFLGRAITQREHLRSIGNNAPFLARVLRD